MRFDMVIAAVGGQGAVTTAHVIARAAILAGEKARVGETYGAAMRGGSVLSHVRIGDVFSPLVLRRHAHAILGLEPLEGLRAAARFMRRDTLVLLDAHAWYPLDVSLSEVEYPPLEKIGDQLRRAGGRVHVVDCVEAAKEAGSPRTTSIVMVGALFGLQGIPLDERHVIEAIRQTVPPRTVEANIRAFQLGKAQV